MLVVERSSMGPEILLRMVPAEKECLAVRLRVGTGAVFWDLDPFRVVNARERAIVEVHGAIWRKKSRCVVWYGSPFVFVEGVGNGVTTMAYSQNSSRKVVLYGNGKVRFSLFLFVLIVV